MRNRRNPFLKIYDNYFTLKIWINLITAVTLFWPSIGHAAEDYYSHVYFDNSLTPETYFYSSGQAIEPSFLRLKNWKLPVDTKTFLTPPNALRLEWQSEAGGGWEAEVRLVNFRNRFPQFRGSNLYMWCYAVQPIAKADLPLITLSNTREGLQVAQFPGSFTDSLPLANFSDDIPAGRWIRIRIPFSAFKAGSIYGFEPKYLQNIIFLQGRADGVRHTLILDEIRIDDDEAVNGHRESETKLTPPANVTAIGYDRHVEIRWDDVKSPRLAHYVIYRSVDRKEFEPIGIQLPGTHRYTDFLGKAGVKAEYKVAVSDKRYRLSALSKVASASTREFSDDELLTMLQEACFHYYWEGADPHSGMARESFPGDDRIVATGASGFGIMALVVGTVPDTNRPRVAVSGEMVERVLGEVGLTADPVHDLNVEAIAARAGFN